MDESGRIGRIAEAVARHGVGGALRDGWRRLVFDRRRFYLFVRPLAADEVPAADVIRCRLAVEDDLPSLDCFADTYRREQFAEWLREGKFVFLAFDGDAPVAYQIATTRSRTVQPYSLFPLAPGQVWVVLVKNTRAATVTPVPVATPAAPTGSASASAATG